MRLTGVRVAAVLAGLLFTSACHGHARVEGCAYHSCPAPPSPQVTTVLRVDGEVYRDFRATHRLAFGRSYDMALTVIPEKGARITRYWLGEVGTSYGSGPDGPVGIRRLGPTQGTLASGATVHVRWTPALTGTRGLLLTYTVLPVPGTEQRGGETMHVVGDFLVSNGTTLRVAYDCAHVGVKPTSIVVRCDDPSERLTSISYESWSPVAAYGHGTLVAHGRSEQVDVRLSKVREMPDGPRFTEVRLTYSKSRRVETLRL